MLLNKAKYERRMQLLKTALIFGVCLMALTPNVCASATITGKIDNLKDLVLGIIQSAGAIVLLWGIFEFASAYQAHDTTQQTASLKKVISGILMVGAGTVVTLVS